MVRLALCVTVVLLLLADPANSQTHVDGSTDLVCSPTEASLCNDTGRCRQGDVRGFNLPRFITLKFSTGEFVFKYSGDRVKIGKLDQVQDAGKRLVIHDVIDDGAVTIVIIKDKKEFLASGIRPNVNFFVAGFCERY